MPCGSTEIESCECRLCGFSSLVLVNQDKRRSFYICENCELVSVPKRCWLSADDEKRRYSLHDNSVSNAGYVKFLSQMVDEIRKTAGFETGVLDFGSGGDATLCQLLDRAGINCHSYDPLFGRFLQNTASCFGVVVLCEVIEHLRDIRRELELINKLLRKGGSVLLRTQIYSDTANFHKWWYAQDPTHINFFNEKSLQTTAALLGKHLLKTGHPDIFVLN